MLLFGGNCRNFLAQTSTKKAQGSGKKLRNQEKKKNVVSHIFIALSKILSKKFLPKPQIFEIAVRKKARISGKKAPRCPLHTKKQNVRNFREKFCSECESFLLKVQK